MATYVLLTKLSPEVLNGPRSIEELGRAVTERLHNPVSRGQMGGQLRRSRPL